MGSKVAKLIDVTRCTGCRGCQVACKQWNELGPDLAPNLGSVQSHKDLGPNTYLVVQFHEHVDEKGSLDWLFRKHSCMHCSEAACVKVCPTGALGYKDNGIVARDYDKCVGCGYCVNNCTFHISKLNREKEKATKCTFCEDRVMNGQEPACSKACNSDCIQFGDRDEMIALGKQKVEKLKAAGNSKANLWGETQVGGTHQLYVLANEPEAYGLPSNPQVPLTVTLWQDVVKPLGALALGGAVAATLVSYAMNRGKGKADDASADAGKGGESHGG